MQRFWTKPDRTQQQVKLAVTEAMRGGFTVHLTQVRQNRAYLQSRRVDVPWNNKELDLKWEHFVSKLQPGQKETWILQIQSPKASTQKPDKKLAELVATLYDESLDAFVPHNWPHQFSIFRQDYSTLQSQFANQVQAFESILGSWEQPYEAVVITCQGHPLARRKKLTLEDISRYPLILPPRNLSTWGLVDSTFKKHGLAYQVAMEVGGWEVIKKYVELGLGISIIMSIGITGEEKLAVIPAGEFFPNRTYGVVQRKGRIFTPQAKRFVSMVLNPALTENAPA